MIPPCTMWSNGFLLSLEIDRPAGWRLPLLVGAAGTLALAAIALSGLPQAWTMAAVGLVLVYAPWGSWSLMPRSRKYVAGFRIAADGSCRIRVGGGLLEASLQPGWVWPGVAVGIHFITGEGIRRGVILFRDQVEPASWRRLLVRCRQANAGPMT